MAIDGLGGRQITSDHADHDSARVATNGPDELDTVVKSGAATAIVTMLLLLACTPSGERESRDSASAGTAGLAAGDRVAFRLPALEGGQIGPADFRGRVVLLDFWATWCVPCRAQKAVLEEMAAGYPEGALQILAVNVGEDDGVVHDSVADEPSAIRIVLDRDTSLFTSLGLATLPSLIVLDSEGRLVERATGLIDTRMLRDMIRKAGLEPAARFLTRTQAEGGSP